MGSLVEICPLTLVCVKCFLRQRAPLPGQTWAGDSTEKLAGHGCNTTSDQKVYTVELSNNIQNQYCGTFYSCKKKKRNKGFYLFSISSNLEQRSFLHPKHQILKSSPTERSAILYFWMRIKGNYSTVSR